MFHEVFATAKSPYGHTAANDFAEASEVRGNAQPALCALRTEAEACHYFVKN